VIEAPSGSHVSVLPATLGERARAAGPHEVTPEAILFRVPGTLTALVSATDIDIEPVSGVDAGELTWWREHHLASAQRLLRGTLSLWASGIVCAGGAVAFIGEEGAGKSAVAAALAQHGHHSVLSDTALAVQLRGGTPVAIPGDPMLALPRGALAQLELSDEHGQPFRGGVRKRACRFNAAAHAAAVPLKTVIVLRRTLEDVAPEPDSLHGPDAFQAIRHATLLANLIAPAGLRAAHFGWCSAIAARARMLIVRSSRFRDDVADVAAVVAAELGT
jgi:hypothetical protein